MNEVAPRDFETPFDCDLFLQEMRACRLCHEQLPFEPKPVFQLSPNARLLLVGQAPGMRAHLTGTPFNDPSGDRLRKWLGVTREQFYDPDLFALLPMGLCYPGVNARGGDNPPCKTCGPFWHPQTRPYLPNIKLTLLVGQYAHAYYLKEKRAPSLTQTVASWRDYLPDFLPLPHPSWRNTGWLKKHPWFEQDVIPFLQEKIQHYLTSEPAHFTLSTG